MKSGHSFFQKIIDQMCFVVRVIRRTETHGVAGLCLDQKFDSVRKMMMMMMMKKNLKCMKRRTYVCYSESKYHLRICLAHPRDSHFAHVQ